MNILSEVKIEARSFSAKSIFIALVCEYDAWTSTAAVTTAHIGM